MCLTPHISGLFLYPPLFSVMNRGQEAALKRPRRKKNRTGQVPWATAGAPDGFLHPKCHGKTEAHRTEEAFDFRDFFD